MQTDEHGEQSASFTSAISTDFVTHLSGELLKDQANIYLRDEPYRSTSPPVSDIIPAALYAVRSPISGLLDVDLVDGDKDAFALLDNARLARRTKEWPGFRGEKPGLVRWGQGDTALYTAGRTFPLRNNLSYSVFVEVDLTVGMARCFNRFRDEILERTSLDGQPPWATHKATTTFPASAHSPS